MIDKLPQELLVIISSQLPLPTFLNLASVARSLRYRLLGVESDRDAFARSWITQSAPWYLPLPLHPSLKNAWKESNYLKQEEADFAQPENEPSTLSWAYLRRCLASASMKNRKRIWGVALQIEEKANELEI